MSRSSRVCLVQATALAAAIAAFDMLSPSLSRAQVPGGAAIFASRCAVCHGPHAAGIPGTFPSLHEQVVAFAKTPAGRDYLVMVVTTGLMGELTVGTVHYNNVMPAQSGLSEDDVAAVLDYLAADLGKNDDAANALSAADVKEIRLRHTENSPQSTRALRPSTSP